MDKQSLQKTIDYAGKNFIFFFAVISFLLGVIITSFFVNFNPKTVSNDDGSKNHQNSQDYEIPLEIELQALYDFPDIKVQLISLDEEIVKEAKDRISKQEQGSDDPNDYQKFIDPSFRSDRLKTVLGIDISDIKPEITIKKDEIKKIIKAIYVFQVRFLEKDQFQKLADGQINQNTKNEIIRQVLLQNTTTTSTQIPPDTTKHNTSDTKAIKGEYELAINKQVMRYAMNLQEQRCEENWQMLGSITQDGYGNNQLNYAKYCILHRNQIPDNKETPIVKPEKSSSDSQDRQMYKYIENFQRIKTDPPERETLKFCASSFNDWKKNKTIKLDITTGEPCPLRN